LNKKDLAITINEHVATVEISRPPHNYFDLSLIKGLADSFDELDNDTACRAIVLCSKGKSFCAGASFGDGNAMDNNGNTPGSPDEKQVDKIYREAVRLFSNKKPVVAAIHGAAIGGGLGLAMVADFRVTCPEARFSANFTRLGFHPGFGLTATLPDVIGMKNAAMMFYTSLRINGTGAHSMGLADLLVPLDQVRKRAIELCAEIAVNAPLAVMSARETLRAGLAEKVRTATRRELQEQTWLRKTEDFKEGVAAVSERRLPDFKGR